jgi:formylmethanofuran dehydrogenase subunit A
VVVEEGEVREISEGREFIVHPDFDPQIEEVIRPQFQNVYTISFENYPTEMSRLHHPEIVPCNTKGPGGPTVVPSEPA